jgi:hypothetical protein
MQDTVKPTRRYRPLGISIAILSTLIMYALYPLIYVYPAVWSLFTRRNSGIDFIGGTWGVLGVIIAAFVLVASIAAWIGRPTGVRMIYILLVWTAAAVQFAKQIPALNPPQAGVPSVGTDFQAPPIYFLCLGILNFLIPLYVTWYLNRAPARAFYGVAVPMLDTSDKKH